MLRNTYLLPAMFLFFPGMAVFAQDFSFAFGIGGTGQDRGERITVDADGNLIATGYFTGTVDFDGDQSANQGNISSQGSADIYLAKYNANGVLLWAFGIGGSGRDEGKSVVTDAAGNVYVTGFFRRTADFDPGNGTQKQDQLQQQQRHLPGQVRCQWRLRMGKTHGEFLF